MMLSSRRERLAGAFPTPRRQLVRTGGRGRSGRRVRGPEPASGRTSALSETLWSKARSSAGRYSGIGARPMDRTGAVGRRVEAAHGRNPQVHRDLVGPVKWLRVAAHAGGVGDDESVLPDAPIRQVDDVRLSSCGCGGRRPCWRSQPAVSAGEGLEDLAGQVAFQASDDLRSGPAIGCPSCRGVACSGAVAEAIDGRHAEGPNLRTTRTSLRGKVWNPWIGPPRPQPIA